jgi:dihydroxyacid dehydratase/phosphogluconate dehydratase
MYTLVSRQLFKIRIKSKYRYTRIMELNKYSITQDETQPAAQAMLYGIGLTEEDLNKAQVGIVSMG